MTTAFDIDTYEPIAVQPVAVYGSSAFDTLVIVDGDTGRGLWFDPVTREWYTDLRDDDLGYTAERIDGIYGSYETDWEAAADAKLAGYGLKLGEFDEANGDRYTLVEA